MKTQEQQGSSLKSPIQSDCRPSPQMKPLQFRCIAPKAPAMGTSTAVVSCQSPVTLPEASTAVSPKSILVPAQNYALMKVAGQECTFSLVALPQTPPQSQIQKNLKLPIPRYQPTKIKRVRKHSNKTQSPAKVNGCSQTTSSMEKMNSAIFCLPETPECKPFVRVGTAASSEVLLPEKAVVYPISKSEQAMNRSMDSLSKFSYATGASTAMISAPLSNGSPTKAQAEVKVTAAPAITVLSPTVFSKAVQIIPSPPKGKIPILPYTKMKSSLLPSTGISCTQSLGKISLCQARNDVKSSPVITAATTDEGTGSNQNAANNGQCKNPPPKKRGRKRKTMDDILSFEARKKRSLSFFSRRLPEKAVSSTQSSSSQDKVVDISKKYRSIRPKPVLLMEPTVPQLVPLTSLSVSEKQDQERIMNQQIPGKSISVVQPGSMSMQAPWKQSAIQAEKTCNSMYANSQAPHRCSTCSKCFQFKHHLQSHMNSHSNLRPYSCPVCRKAYAHSGSLSTHMKLHHSEGKPRKSLRCEFCEKAFGYVGVYFSHLREVHRVILTVEPSVSQHEDSTPVERTFHSEDLASEQPVDPVELQIKCGRCQAVTPTFTDMKLHLFYVHGEDIRVPLKDGREAENELVKHAAHYWRQLNERRNLVQSGSCDEEFFSFNKLKRHLHSHHQGALESHEEEQEQEVRVKEKHVSRCPSNILTPRLGSQLNCILCSEVLYRKQDLLEHWRICHNCDNPALLWQILHSQTSKP